MATAKSNIITTLRYVVFRPTCLLWWRQLWVIRLRKIPLQPLQRSTTNDRLPTQKSVLSPTKREERSFTDKPHTWEGLLQKRSTRTTQRLQPYRSKKDRIAHRPFPRRKRKRIPPINRILLLLPKSPPKSQSMLPNRLARHWILLPQDR